MSRRGFQLSTKNSLNYLLFRQDLYSYSVIFDEQLSNYIKFIVVVVVQVALEAMDKKTRDMAIVVKMEPPDLKRLQLLLGGSISTQVNQGIQEYIAFFRDSSRLHPEHVEQLKQMYRQVCITYCISFKLS